MSKPVYYVNAPDKCDLCGTLFGKKMYDARIPWSSWGNMCESCFKESGCKLGTGSGQEYTRVVKGCDKPSQCVKIAHLPFVSKAAVDTLTCSDGCQLVGRWLKTGG